jgi:IclR family transcriptional regulator, KDG regulon repressor
MLYCSSEAKFTKANLPRIHGTNSLPLGLRLFDLGSRAIASLDLRERSRPHLNMVLHETEETVHFCLFDQGEVLYMEKMESQRGVRMSSSIGRRA